MQKQYPDILREILARLESTHDRPWWRGITPLTMRLQASRGEVAWPAFAIVQPADLQAWNLPADDAARVRNMVTERGVARTVMLTSDPWTGNTALHVQREHYEGRELRYPERTREKAIEAIARWLRYCDSEQDGLQTQSPTLPDPDRGRLGFPMPKATVNARMLDVITHKPECRGWTISQWQRELKCSRAAIQKTETWKQLNAARNLMRAEHATTKRRRMKN